MYRNFSWLIENEFAAMARPSTDIDDFDFLNNIGINVIVSFTEIALDRELIDKFDFIYLHLPIPDFSIPTFEQIEEFINFTSRFNKNAIVVHCDSGFGRTGTMSAIYFVNRGYSAFDAIKFIRQKRPGSIETKEQENVVFKYEILRS